MSESLIARTIQKSTTKLAVFVLLGTMMIFLVPMIAEKADARTIGYVQVNRIMSDPPFSNVKGILDAGKWIQHPKLLGTGWGIEWITAGSGLFGGDEKGRILADVGPGRHVTLHWSNPDRGDNTCSAQWTGPIDTVTCSITDGPVAYAKYVVYVRR